eukprot:GSChrysophyteH1.ASY1.ANO1.1383.1 assembled CDS
MMSFLKTLYLTYNALISSRKKGKFAGVLLHIFLSFTPRRERQKGLKNSRIYITYAPKMAMVLYSESNEAASEGRSDFVGLSNQGATCYLNGLLQTLYMTPEFRRAIFAWHYDEEKDGSEEHCIPLQLQKLFGFLTLSRSKYTDTIALTKSFGWEGSEVFQQQDVQELSRVLFDALEESFRGTNSEDTIETLFTGKMVSYLRCLDADYESERSESFQDLSLAIVPFGGAPRKNLMECIEHHILPEILDGSNQYRVEESNTLSDAIKGLKFCELPKILSVHLKRFVFDFTGENITQKKLNDIVKFPLVLDMNQYDDEFEAFLAKQISKLRRSADARGKWVYELYAVLIHSGSLHGGHYYAYVKDLDSQKWWNFNDSSVTEMKESDVFAGAGARSTNDRALSSSSAYMLMYRQCAADGSTVELPSEKDVPSYIQELVRAEEKENEKKRRQELERRSKIQLRVHYDGGSKIANDAKSATVIVRVRDYNGYIKAATAAHDVEKKGATSLERISFHDYKEILVETKMPSEEWSVWHPDGLSLNLHCYDSERNSTTMHQVRLPRYATVSELRQVAMTQAMKSNCNYTKVRLMKIMERYKNRNYDKPVYEADVFSVGSKRLKEDLRVYDNTSIYCEQHDGSDVEVLTESTSPCVARYVQVKNTITLKINRPPSLSFDESISANSFWTVADLRDAIAAKLDLDQKCFKMHKSNTYGVELRLGDTHTLAKSYIYNNSTVAIALGAPAVLGQYTLKTALLMSRMGVANQKVHLLPEHSKAEGGDGVEDITVSAETDVTDEMNLSKSPGKGESVVLFGDIDDEENEALVGDCVFSSSFSAGDDDDEIPALVVAEARASEDSQGGADVPVVTSYEVQLLQSESMAVAVSPAPEESEVESESKLVPLPEPQIRPLSSALKASLEGQLQLRPPSVSPRTSEPPELVPLVLEEGKAFVKMNTQYSTSATDFEMIPLNVSVSKDTPVTELREDIFQKLQKYDSDQKEKSSEYSPLLAEHQTDARFLRLRMSHSAWKPPGDILRDGLTVEQAMTTPLMQDKQLILQLRDVPEELPKRMKGDMIVLVQRWHRDTWTLGLRHEVYLRGGLSIRETATHLAELFDIPLETLSVYLLDKLGADVPLHRLQHDTPADSFYSSSRSWFSPQDGSGLLRYNDTLRIGEGDLLILQDTAETLRELSDAEAAAVTATVSSSASSHQTNVSYDSRSSSGDLIYGSHASNRIRTGGIKIKTHRDRLREDSESKDSLSGGSNSPVTPPARGGSASDDAAADSEAVAPANVSGCVATSADTADFQRHGGSAQFDDIF